MSSKEYQSCALTEGVAHFFSAATWNDFSSQTDCLFQYWDGSTIDCEAGLSTDWPVAYMETLCSTSSNTNRGVELDWLRQMWDVKTDGTGPFFGDLLDWLLTAYVYGFFGWGDPYGQLEDSSDAFGGALNSNWDNAKSVNGIDW
jgi:hypothetical protein